jgi:starch synthase (maltosyl-transferring)
MSAHVDKSHIVIEHIAPELDCGRYRAKAVTGDAVEVSADIFRFGTDVIQAVIRYRGPSRTRWSEEPMHDIGNDRFHGHFQPNRIGVWRYSIEAWTDHFATWRQDLIKRVDAGQDVDLELQEGVRLIQARLDQVPARQRRTLEKAIDLLRKPGTQKARVKAALDATVSRIMTRYPDRSDATSSSPLELTVDRDRARFGAWYEFFPRSTGRPGEHGTFRTAAKALPRIADMGFDVIYLPPIHPIGTTNRKGKNNTLRSDPSDVGVPWAIGSEEGGHKDINAALGTIGDFDSFVAEAERLGLEVCLDFAIQCAPDHPWVKEHPDWFHHRPDGAIRYAENPPKKYEDIYPVNFDTEDKEGLWNELKSTVDHWIAHGVKIFRVDNPHTKPFPFWEWVIGSIKSDHPDVIFLSEAFTRPKVMQNLAKLGFTQSYTYFTWRNAKWELEQYVNELTQTEMANYFRPNFFANTPDILHEYLQTGGPPAFKIRLVLAAFLSPTYGIYSGFELFENVPVREGSEEYLNSEKYELRHRDWTAQPNLSSYIANINDIRHKHPPLSELTNIRFHYVDKDSVMCFSKTSPGYDPILVVVSLNPFDWEEATVNLNLHELGLADDEAFEVHDLLTDTTYVWHGSVNYVRLDPSDEPAHIFRVRV